jgi:DNA polymerase-1
MAADEIDTKDHRLLIDADGFLYRSAAASEYEANWGDGIFVASTNIGQAQDMFRSQMKSIGERLDSDIFVMVLSGSDNFRYGIDPSYKSNRKGNRKPLGYTTLVEWLYEEYGDKVVLNDRIEADDYMGILATNPKAPPSVIVSDDKDMMTIPGKLFRLGVLSAIDEQQADRYWLSQVLTGDPADGYKGCPGIGVVKAEKVLSKPGLGWENVKREFLKAGLSEDYAVLQARLARILRYEDWDGKLKQPILWTPPSV